MAESKRTGSGKRFGPRYGRRLKAKVEEIEAGYRGRTACPYCGKQSVKRKSIGIWHCLKCNTTFTGRAYESIRTIDVSEEPSKEVTNNG